MITWTGVVSWSHATQSSCQKWGGNVATGFKAAALAVVVTLCTQSRFHPTTESSRTLSCDLGQQHSCLNTSVQWNSQIYLEGLILFLLLSRNLSQCHWPTQRFLTFSITLDINQFHWYVLLCDSKLLKVSFSIVCLSVYIMIIHTPITLLNFKICFDFNRAQIPSLSYC